MNKMWLSSNACLKKIGRKYVYIILSFNKCSHAKRMIRQVDSTTFTLSKGYQYSIAGWFCFQKLPQKRHCSFLTGSGGSQQFPKRTLAEGSDCGETSEDGRRWRRCAVHLKDWNVGSTGFFSHVHIAAIVSVSCLVLCWMNRGVQISNMWWNGVSAKTPGNFDTELLWDAFKLKTWKLIYDHIYTDIYITTFTHMWCP